MISLNRKSPTVSLIFLLCGLFASKLAFAWSVSTTSSGDTLVENFLDISQWDAANSTGLWNIVDQAAEAGRVTGAVASQTISFGDGSAGVLNSSTGYTFNTNSYPNGFNFISVNITGGTIQVTGSNPLIIRSLSTVNIVPSLSARGGDGGSGTANGSTTGPSGGAAVASLCAGGSGGSATGASGQNGGADSTYNGTVDSTATPGTGSSGGSTGGNGVGGFDGPGATNLWETSPNFQCGAGGGGGGGHVNGANHATGGAGGAGGGTIRISAVGSITYTQIDASGGNGGLGANDGVCSGGGGGGNGGAIWLQSLQTVSGSTPTVNAGNNETNCVSGSGNLPGATRTDTATSSGAGNFATGLAAPNQSYNVQTKAYDLGTQNAGFSTQPTIGSVLNGGSIVVTYQGSSDGVNYSQSTSDITKLNNTNIRYIKIGMTISTGSTAAATPMITSISIPFSELNIRLAGGCGSMQTGQNGNRKTYNKTGMHANAIWSTAFWLTVWGMIYGFHRRFSLKTTEKYVIDTALN